MAKSLPYFRWFTADAESDERYRSMTDAQCGFFHRCLNMSWENEGLPADMDRLASMMRVSRDYLDSVFVRECWHEKDGRLYNRRQEEERAHATSNSEKRSASAKQMHSKRRANAEQMQSKCSARAYESESVSESDSSEKETSEEKPETNVREFPVLMSWQVDETYVPFVEVWRRVQEVTGKALLEEDFTDAHFRWKRMDIDQKLLAIKTTSDHLDLGVWTGATDPQFIPLPGRYLEKEYKRPVASPKARDPASRSSTDAAKAIAMRNLEQRGSLL